PPTYNLSLHDALPIFIHLGVLQALPLFDDRVLLCDIGGGSTEVLLGRQGDVLASRSFRIGAIRVTERFLAKDPVKPKHVERCRRYAETILTAFGDEVAGAGFDTVVGASGTIETVVAMALAARDDGGGGLRTLNGQRITAAEVTEVVELLAATPEQKERASLP